MLTRLPLPGTRRPRQRFRTGLVLVPRSSAVLFLCWPQSRILSFPSGVVSQGQSAGTPVSVPSETTLIDLGSAAGPLSPAFLEALTGLFSASPELWPPQLTPGATSQTAQSLPHCFSWGRNFWFLWQFWKTCNCGFLKSKTRAEV